MVITMDIIGMHTGGPLLVHLPEACAGQWCCIHNPSAHRMMRAPLVWVQSLGMMWRRCEHGHDHPDPDDLDYHLRTLNVTLVEAATSAHIDRCDGCCGGLRHAP
jgi:hypothetical protein